MNDLDRNTRMLIVCFAVALGALIPLRFVEAGQIMVVRQSQVLGEMSVPEFELDRPAQGLDPARLEAPYDQIDGGVVGCIDAREAGVLIDRLTGELIEGIYSEVRVKEILGEAEKIEERVCE